MNGLRSLAGIVLASFFWVSSYAAEQNIVEIASANPNFSTLVSLLKKADLVSTLEGEGPFTVFAPTNEAFAAIPASTLEELSNDPAKLKAVLLYHVVSGKVMSAQVKPGNVATVEGADIQVTDKDGKMYINDAQIVTADIDASNGVIHVVDKVIMPAKK